MSPLIRSLSLCLGCTVMLVFLSGCESLSRQRDGGADVVPPRSTQVAALPDAAADPRDALLVGLEAVPSGEHIALSNGLTAVADDSYAAASGYVCRWVGLTGQDSAPERRLACRVGPYWQWAAAVTPDRTR